MRRLRSILVKHVLLHDQKHRTISHLSLFFELDMNEMDQLQINILII